MVPFGHKGTGATAVVSVEKTIFRVIFHVVHILSGKASCGSRTTCISIFISAPNKKTLAHDLQQGILKGNTANNQPASET